MVFKVLGSSSKGNGYILDVGSQALIIEAGIHIDKVLDGVNYEYRKIAGCIVTHRHGDHYKHHKQYLDHGISLYSSAGTFGDDMKHFRAIRIEADKRYHVGEFQIIPFPVVHDVPEPFGYFIHHPNMGNALFITDTKYIPHKFKKLNHVFIEANYDQDLVTDKAWSGKMPGFLHNRITQSHMSLEDCIGILENQDLKMVRKIVLLHLSDSNSIAPKFIARIHSKFGKEVQIANPGDIINVNINPY